MARSPTKTAKNPSSARSVPTWGPAWLLGGCLLVGIVVAGGGAGCSSSATAVVPPKPCEVQVVSLSVIAAPVINQTDTGEARPVLFRVYQLKDPLRLDQAAFEAIWKSDGDVLGDSVVKRDEIFVYPDTRTEVKFERSPEAGTVVGAALFRGHKGRSWYYSFELPPPPGKGDCRTPECTGGETGSCGLNLNPRFSMWLDGTRVDDGSDHLEDVTDERRVRVVLLSGASPPGDGSGSAPPALPPPGAKKR